MKYRVRMSGWDYQGMDEDTIEVDSVEPSSPSFRGEF